MSTTQIHLCFKEQADANENHLWRVQINADDGEQILLLECKYWEGVPFRHQFYSKKDNLIIINKQKYPFTGYTEWAGNLFWNAYKLQKGDVLRLLNDLMLSGDWSIDEGWELPFEKFQAKNRIEAADLEWDAAIEASSYNENQMSLF